MTAAVRTDRSSHGLPGDLVGVFNVAFIIMGDNHRDRKEDTRRRQVGVYLDLGCRVTLTELVDDPVDVWSEAVVGLPRDPTSDDEVALSAPEFGVHTQ